MSNVKQEYPDVNSSWEGSKVKMNRKPSATTKNISWGDEYKGWPIEKRLHYAERLAASMNNAADVMQQERDELNRICRAQENQLNSATEKYVIQGQLMHDELQKSGNEKQELYVEIVSLNKKIKDQRHEIDVLESKLEKAGGNISRLGN